MNTLPTVSLVTPCYNGAAYLEAAMASVLDQAYPALEYVVVDGGSTDGSAALVARHADRLHWWASEPDDGQYAALDKGFAHTSGEIMGWLNADDVHFPWTLSVVAELFATFPGMEWLTTLYPLILDARGRVVRCAPRPGFTRRGFERGENLPGRNWYATQWIQQESTFWRRSLWRRAGGHLDAALRYAGDFELWARFHQHADLWAVDTPLAGFRRHGDQKTGYAAREYADEAVAALLRHGGRPAGRLASLWHAALARGLPNRWRPAAARLGLVAPARIVAWDGSTAAWRATRR